MTLNLWDSLLKKNTSTTISTILMISYQLYFSLLYSTVRNYNTKRITTAKSRKIILLSKLLMIWTSLFCITNQSTKDIKLFIIKHWQQQCRSLKTLSHFKILASSECFLCRLIRFSNLKWIIRTIHPSSHTLFTIFLLQKLNFTILLKVTTLTLTWNLLICKIMMRWN